MLYHPFRRGQEHLNSPPREHLNSPPLPLDIGERVRKADRVSFTFKVKKDFKGGYRWQGGR